MKIINNNLGVQRYSTSGTTNIRQKEEVVLSTARSFDAITIHADKAEIMDQAFAKKISDKLKSDIRKPVEKEKLDSIKERIDSGNYKIDRDMLIKKLMLEA